MNSIVLISKGKHVGNCGIPKGEREHSCPHTCTEQYSRTYTVHDEHQPAQPLRVCTSVIKEEEEVNVDRRLIGHSNRKPKAESQSPPPPEPVPPPPEHVPPPVFAKPSDTGVPAGSSWDLSCPRMAPRKPA